MYKNTKILALIPARGGSKGLPRKNILPLCGKPLISYSIKVAKESKLIDRVIVTTDDEEIADVAKKYGAETPFIRPAKLAQDDTPPFPVLEHALKFLKKEENYKPDIIVWLEPPNPFRDVKRIDEAIKFFVSDSSADSLRSVCEPELNPYKMWIIEGVFLEPLMGRDNEALHGNPRQKLKKVYSQNGFVFLFRYGTIMKKRTIVGDKILPFVVSDRFINIETKEDLEYAEFYFKKYAKNKNFVTP